METIHAFVEKHPDNQTYFGIGYPEWAFDEKGPRKEELDAICADKPVYLMSNGGHEGWCNSKTFEVLNITKDTPDPLLGYSYFHRSENGEPTGHIIETVAQQMVMNQLPLFARYNVLTNTSSIWHYCAPEAETFWVNGATGISLR